jgi:hypothetical protein
VDDYGIAVEDLLELDTLHFLCVKYPTLRHFIAVNFGLELRLAHTMVVQKSDNWSSGEEDGVKSE